MTEKHARHGSLLALTPLLVFLATYLAASLITGDFYRMPISVAFLAAAVYAVATTRRLPFAERIEHFSAGAANGNILLMIWIFILAGAFAESARSMGAINVQLILEGMGGGGHQTMAAAQLKHITPEAARARIEGAIDKYYASQKKGDVEGK